MDFLSQISQDLNPHKITIEEFAESSQYCNKKIYPRQKLFLKLIFLEELTGPEWDTLRYWQKGGFGNEITISPGLEKRIEYLKDEGYSHFREVDVVGGRRCSKGFVTGISMAYKMFNALQLGDPNDYYGIDADKQIYFPCVASSLEQARKYQYADFSTTVAGCFAFQQNLTKVFEREFSVATDKDIREMSAHKRKNHKIGRDVSKLRGNALAANANTIRGLAAMVFAFDEMAFMEVGEETDASAEKVYDAAIPSLAQFGVDAMIFCCSSPYTKLGRFFERFSISQAMEKDGVTPSNPTSIGFQFPSWALFEGWWDEPLWRGPRKCITASPDWDPERKKDDGEYFFTREDRQSIMLARQEEKDNPDVYKVERRGQFAEVVDAYLKPELVDRMYAGRPQPDGERVPFRLNWDAPNGFEYKYVAHLDPSSTTAGFGFAMGHIEKFPDPQNPEVLQEHVVFDIVKRWKPQDFKGGVIEWETVMREVFAWMWLFHPTEVTMDQYNSDAPIEWLIKECQMRNLGGIRVYKKTATAESNWNRAEIFKTAMYRDLIHAPYEADEDLEYSIKELKYLQQANTGGRFPRVDKQDIGPVQTKDMADCMMTVAETLIGNLVRAEMMGYLGNTGLRPGSLGGYPMGGSNHPLSQQMYGQRSGEQSMRGSIFGANSGNQGSPARNGSWSKRGGRRSGGRR